MVPACKTASTRPSYLENDVDLATMLFQHGKIFSLVGTGIILNVAPSCYFSLPPSPLPLSLVDPSISSCLEELFGVLASNPGCHGILLPRFLPTAVEILDSNESQLPLGLVSVSSGCR